MLSPSPNIEEHFREFPAINRLVEGLTHPFHVCFLFENAAKLKKVLDMSSYTFCTLCFLLLHKCRTDLLIAPILN